MGRRVLAAITRRSARLNGRVRAVTAGMRLPRAQREGRADGIERPDLATAFATSRVLDGLDGIEHRLVELGTPWPQLVVGPTGATIVDVCCIDGSAHVCADGVHDRDRAQRCQRCDTAYLAMTAVREAFESAQLSVPVRMVTVMPELTCIEVAPDAPDDVVVIPVHELGHALSRGPVLPMATVDAAFASLAGTLTTDERLTPLPGRPS